jgi:hypothetical protein
LRISHPSDASTGGDPKVQHGSITPKLIPSLSLDHAISSIAIDPPSECPVKHIRAPSGSEVIHGDTSGQNSSAISLTPVCTTTGGASLPSCSGLGHALPIWVESRTRSTFSLFHAAPRTTTHRCVVAFAPSDLSQTYHLVQFVSPSAISVNPSRRTHGSISPILYTCDANLTATDAPLSSRSVISSSDLPSRFERAEVDAAARREVTRDAWMRPTRDASDGRAMPARAAAAKAGHMRVK